MRIKIDHVSKVYKGKQILDNIELVLEEGRLYGFTGENGTGKTTLFRMIAGFEKTSEGKIYYDDDKLNASHRKKITYMHQKPYMIKASVEENIFYPLKLRKYKMQSSKDQIYEMMEQLDIFRLRDQSATLLSGGEMQKVALARSMIFEPEVLLMDEPSAHIDGKTMFVIEQMIQQRQKNTGMTTAIITHDDRYFKEMFQETFLLSDRRIYKQ